MNEKLKPCPFCGGEAMMKYLDMGQAMARNNGQIPSTYGRSEAWGAYVGCTNWGCPGYGDPLTVDVVYSEAAAIAAWNRRSKNE